MKMQIENEWSLRVPTSKDEDDDGKILIRGDSYLDIEKCGWNYSVTKVSREVYLRKGLSCYWKRTDEWVNSREVFERRIIQIAGVGDGIAALADDGSLWIAHNSKISPQSFEWTQMDTLPSGVRRVEGG